jgi:hypothetical protein
MANYGNLEEIKRDLEALEALVDKYDLKNVLNALVEICHGKAEHLAANWQDPVSAKLWTDAGRRIDAARAKIYV